MIFENELSQFSFLQGLLSWSNSTISPIFAVPTRVAWFVKFLNGYVKTYMYSSMASQLKVAHYGCYINQWCKKPGGSVSF